MLTPGSLEQRVDEVRRFNRFYTQKVGVLGESLLGSPFSLTEVRVLYEIGRREGVAAADLAKELDLDAGYLSRILRGFALQELITKLSSTEDARRLALSLTAKGREVIEPLEAQAREAAKGLLARLPEGDQERIIHSMATIRDLLSREVDAPAAYVLRPPQAGDMGWVVHRHGVLYAKEYGWDDGFEALVAKIVSAFIENFDHKRERCWIAEQNGEIAGCVFLVKESQEVARLRLLLVEPAARGKGLGKRLVDECIRFARQAGYRKVTLWTQSILAPAHHTYQRAGFQLVSEEPHHSFGHDLVGQTWELSL